MGEALARSGKGKGINVCWVCDKARLILFWEVYLSEHLPLWIGGWFFIGNQDYLKIREIEAWRL